jgi:hypothetical protein
MYDSIREVHGSTNSIQQGLNELFCQSDVPLLGSMIQPTVEECIREEYQRNGYGSSSSVDRGIAQEISENNRHLRVPANPHSFFLSWGSSSLGDDQPWAVKRRMVASPRHKYSAWFGIVSTHMKRTITNEEEADGQQLNHREVRDLEIVFTPAPFIRNRQLAATALQWLNFKFQRPEFIIDLQCINVISEDEPIWSALRDCNLLEIRRLFDQRRASPQDRDGEEYTLMHR